MITPRVDWMFTTRAMAQKAMKSYCVNIHHIIYDILESRRPHQCFAIICRLADNWHSHPLLTFVILTFRRYSSSRFIVM